MGRELAEAYPEARDVFQEADDVLGFGLSQLCWEGPEDELTETRNAQPAILTHSIAVMRALGQRLPAVGMAAGHSLGEFSAWVAAGSISLADGVRIVRRRGELMFQSGQERSGTMAAILGLEDHAVEEVCRRSAAEGGDCVPANYNAPGQLVISGDRPTVERAMELAREAGAKRTVSLNVSGAFHSPLMKVAEAGLQAVLSQVPFSPPAFPIVSNVTAEPVRDPVDGRRLLVEQLTAPVRWTASMRRLVDAGPERFVEVGPGNVLAGLLRRVDRGAALVSVGSAEDVRGFA